MKIKLGNAGDSSPRVEVIPLIDIIFCILTFFLLSGLQMARQQAINVNIPQAKTAETQTRELLIVSLDASGQAFIEQQAVPQLEVLSQQIKSYRVTKPNSSIVLYADKAVRYERVIEVLDVLRQAGGDNVALATASVMATPTPTVTISPSTPVLSPSPSSSPVATLKPSPAPR
jgi:biopolymer transport protein ExbD